ncbi:MAG: pentapeptide repeat-containing protein, partial [Okeania sp. SIO2D1]|nr:pentapeptide repeat-containing protein [Okeania sp. SIO2D1]
MKLPKIITISLLTITGLTTPILAENANDLQKFLDNPSAVCQGCDLSGADLSNIRRRG